MRIAHHQLDLCSAENLPNSVQNFEPGLLSEIRILIYDFPEIRDKAGLIFE